MKERKKKKDRKKEKAKNNRYVQLFVSSILFCPSIFDSFLSVLLTLFFLPFLSSFLSFFSVFPSAISLLSLDGGEGTLQLRERENRIGHWRETNDSAYYMSL